MNKSRLMLLALIVALMSSLSVTGCATRAPAPAPAPTPAPAPAPRAAPTPAPAPKAAEKAVSAAEFFKNHVVNMISAQDSSGGAGSVFTGALALFWTEVTGGTMRVAFKGAGGGMPAVNEVWNAKPDGITLGFGPVGSRITGPLAGKDPAIQFKEADRFTWIGNFAQQPYMFAVGAKLPYKSMADLQKAKGLKFGGTGRAKMPAMAAALVVDLFGLDAKVISGFASSGAIGLSTGRGELDGIALTDGTINEQRLKGWTRPLLSLGSERSVLFPDLPTIPEAMKVTPDQRELLETYWLVYLEGQALYGPPGIPEDKVKFLRDSFDKIMKVKGFQEMAGARLGGFPSPVSGGELQALMAKFMALPQIRIDRLSGLLDKHVTTLK